VFPWTSVVILMLGMTTFAEDQSTTSNPLENDCSTSTFGLQVHTGQDGSLQLRSQLPETEEHSPARDRRDISAACRCEACGQSTNSSDASRFHVTPVNEARTVVRRDTGNDSFNEDGADDEFEWQVLPKGLMYKAYLAGEKESRMASVWTSTKGRHGVLWESTLGGHVGLLRYGNRRAINPEGWQLDLEGAAMPRVDMGNTDDLEAVDFRAGVLSTWRSDVNAYKVGYYHLSSHAGDEFLLRVPTYHRLNYVRDSFIVGWTRFLTPDAQAYSEAAYAWNAEDGAKPLEFQYGLQYSPMVFGFRGAPFAAINGHTRQDFNWTTSLTVQAGWQWRGSTNQLWRFGVQYYKGPEVQWEFAGQRQNSFGAGMWFDY